ncbi:Acetyltransferase (GNAT) family protein [Rhizobium tibeticum]|uniref:Acetyltransferase (GNAT) family protein n=2 Tax=Rhizobium tibeticum TaxID=501024 RepID=A0ABY1AYW6_9HYPH|nr:Acetyltransferase (GNAT) family protein [Rhizobium tibeticum]
MFACSAPDGTTIGFLSLKPTSEFAVEIHLMGVKESWHRGIGRALITAAKVHAASQDARL